MYNKGVMCPTVVSYSKARQNLASLMKECVEDSQPVVITSRGRKVVMVPYDDWASEEETRYLLDNPVNRAHLLKSLEQAKRGELVEYKGMFYDEDHSDA